MGNSGSSEGTTENKAVDSNGNINNNIIIQEAKRDIHDQLLIGGKLIIGTYILIGLEAVKITICLFSAYQRYMKKRYQKGNGGQNST